MNCFSANPTFQGEEARSCETSPFALMNCFDANPPPFGAKGRGVAKQASRRLWIALLRREAIKALSNRCASPRRIFAKASHWASFMSLCFVCAYFWQHEKFELLSNHCVHRDRKNASGDRVPFGLLLRPHVVSEDQIVLALMLFASSPCVFLEGQGVLALRLWGSASGFENFSKDPVAQPFASTSFIYIQALLNWYSSLRLLILGKI
jgi:hypothetical protein